MSYHASSKPRLHSSSIIEIPRQYRWVDRKVPTHTKGVKLIKRTGYQSLATPVVVTRITQ